MNAKRELPLWLHRIFNGVFPAALLVGFGSCGLGEPRDSWRQVVSICMIWAGIPVGILFAVFTHRFSIVEGLAGDVGYEED
jgi:hypothetical protein